MGDAIEISSLRKVDPAPGRPNCRLVAAYRSIKVRSAKVLDLRVAELTPRLVQAAVRWRLIGEEGEPLYEFDAAYTLADFGHGLRVSAISHNEAPRLRTAGAE